MKEIAFIVTSLDAGGIENYLLRFLTFAEGNIRACVICKGGRTGELENRYRSLPNVEVVVLAVGFFNVLSWLKLYYFFKRRDFNAVCDFTGNFAGITLLIAQLASIKKRISFYRGSTNHFKETQVKLLYNNLMKKLVALNATKILSNSQAALDYFFPEINKKSNKFKVIYNGIDAAEFLSKDSRYKSRDAFGIPNSKFIVGHTGRYNEAKNHDTILKVAERVCSVNDNIVFVLCGKNTDKGLLNRIKSNPIISEKVITLGYRSDVNQLLRCFDLFFFPSITEGQPNALIEAIISGLPIIASNIEPIRETVPDVLSEMLFDPFDIDGFSNKILELYQQRDVNKNYSEWAIKRYDSNTLFSQFMNELY